MKPLVVVQVHGTSHSGSTLLGLMLGRHPAVYNVGEWINYCTAYFRERWGVELLTTRHEQAQTAASGAKYAPYCSVCGAACPVFPGGEAALSLPLQDHYGELREHLRRFRPGVTAICDTSKWSAFHQLMIEHSVKPVRFVPVISFKAPVRFLVSMLKLARRYGGCPDVDELPAWVTTQLGLWCNFHDAYLAACGSSALPVQHRKLVLDPQRVLTRVLAALGLEYVEGQERYWEEEPHQIAGNPGAHANLRPYQRHVGPDNQLYVDAEGITGLHLPALPDELVEVATKAVRSDVGLAARLAATANRLDCYTVLPL